MAPGDVAHVPRTPSPVAGAGPIAKHFRSRARLRRLLVRLRRPTLQRSLRSLRQGASLTTFGFVTTVPRYLPVASNSLTCVRGADRAYCAPRKWLWRPTFALQKLAAARPPEGHWRALPAAAPCRRTRQRHFAAAASEKSLSTGTRLVASAVGCGGRCRSTSRRTNNKNMFARRLAEQ